MVRSTRFGTRCTIVKIFLLTVTENNITSNITDRRHNSDENYCIVQYDVRMNGKEGKGEEEEWEGEGEERCGK